jgi:hypothetical protein
MTRSDLQSVARATNAAMWGKINVFQLLVIAAWALLIIIFLIFHFKEAGVCF